MTRDTTNNPVWNTRQWLNDRGIEEESALAERLGRFNRREQKLIFACNGYKERGKEYLKASCISVRSCTPQAYHENR